MKRKKMTCYYLDKPYYSLAMKSVVAKTVRKQLLDIILSNYIK